MFYVNKNNRFQSLGTDKRSFVIKGLLRLRLRNERYSGKTVLNLSRTRKFDFQFYVRSKTIRNDGIGR